MKGDNAVYRPATDTTSYLDEGINFYYLWNPSLELLIGGFDCRPEVYSTKGVDFEAAAASSRPWPYYVFDELGERVELTLDEIRELLDKPGWIEPCDIDFADKSFTLDFEGAEKASREQAELMETFDRGLTEDGRAARAALVSALLAPGRNETGDDPTAALSPESLYALGRMIGAEDYYNPSAGLYVLSYTGYTDEPAIVVNSTPVSSLRDYGESRGWDDVSCDEYYMTGPDKTGLLYMPLDSDAAIRAMLLFARSIAADKDKWVEAGALTKEFVERCEEMAGPQENEQGLARVELDKSARDAIWGAKKLLLGDLRDELGESDRDIITPGGSADHIAALARGIDVLNTWNEAPLDNFNGYLGAFQGPDDAALAASLADPEKLAHAAVSAALAERRDLEHDAWGREHMSVRLRDALRCELSPGEELPRTRAGRDADELARSIWVVSPDDVKEIWRSDHEGLRELTDGEAHEIAVVAADNIATGDVTNPLLWDIVREQLEAELDGMAEEIEREKATNEPVVDMDIEDEGFRRE